MPTTITLPRLLPVAVLVALLALALTATAAAAPTSACGAKVIDDWYDNGRVDGTYPPRCYNDAVKALPRDVRDYSSAKEDITRALQARLRNEQAPPATSDPTPGDPISNVQDPDDLDGDGLENAEDPSPGTETTPTETEPETETEPTETTPDAEEDPADDEDTEAVADVDTTSADSLPVPLLVLAGLALLLVAAGTAAYALRRYQARRLPPTP